MDVEIVAFVLDVLERSMLLRLKPSLEGAGRCVGCQGYLVVTCGKDDPDEGDDVSG